jgi:WXG100 family type VII secretion target
VVPARKIQANYDSLRQISLTFSREAQKLDHMLQQVGRTCEGLQNGGWKGSGANAFFAEMNELVIPGMRRLVSALDDASSTTQKISNAFEQAETEASYIFLTAGFNNMEEEIKEVKKILPLFGDSLLGS